MWMDWDNDYYTFSDTNIEYIWRFLKEVHRRGWLFQGHRSTQWCPRCGTSLSQHEQAGEGNYEELDHPSLYVRFPLKDREGESLVVWTTTPWTLPANVAAAVRPDAEYGLRDGGWRLAETGGEYEHVVRGEELVGLEYDGPFDDLDAAGAGVVHRVIPWDDVALDEGTGIVHIAPGAGTEDFELSKVHDLPVLVPIDESGRFYPAVRPVRRDVDRRGRGAGRSRRCASGACWSRRGGSPTATRSAGAAARRSSSASSTTGSSASTRCASSCSRRTDTVEWTPPQYGKRMDDWLRQHGRLEHLAQALLRPAAALLPVLVRAPERDRLARGARGAGGERARAAAGAPPARGSTRCRSAASRAAVEVRRIPEVGDAWLDAGIVPLSTLGWESPRYDPARLRDRRGRGADRRRPPRPRVLGAVVSRPTGSRRCASRSGSGSTRSSSCR